MDLVEGSVDNTTSKVVNGSGINMDKSPDTGRASVNIRSVLTCMSHMLNYITIVVIKQLCCYNMKSFSVLAANYLRADVGVTRSHVQTDVLYVIVSDDCCFG